MIIRLISRLVGLRVTDPPDESLLRMALNRKGTVNTARRLVTTSSMRANAVLPPAWATRVCPCARVEGPIANAVSPAK